VVTTAFFSPDRGDAASITILVPSARGRRGREKKEEGAGSACTCVPLASGGIRRSASVSSTSCPPGKKGRREKREEGR